MEQITYRFQDICQTITDYVANGSFKSLADNVQYSNDKDYARLIRLVDFNSNYDEKNAIWVPESSYKFLKKSVLYGNEVIISNVGANLGTVFKCPKLNYPMTLGPNSILIKTNDLCNQDYLYYYLKSRIGYNKVMTFVSGSAMPKFNKAELRNMEVSLPNRNYQDKAAELLSKIDKKIELNNRINNNLLEQIKSIYKEIFIKYDDYKRLDEISNVTIGKTPPRSEHECFTTDKKDIKWISISDLGKSGMFIFDTSEKLTKEAVEKYNVRVIPKDTVILSFKLTVGRTAFTTEDMTTNEAIAHFNLNNKELNNYLYCYLTYFNYSDLGSTSSIATAINSKIVKSIKIGIPSEEELNKFNKLTSSMFELVKNNEKENIKLSELRDTLLPKLMNGEINLDNIEI